jgi:hypothetical protein
MILVRDLIASLAAMDPDLPVVLDCENRGDPHPLTVARAVAASEGDGMTVVGHVLLHGSTAVDFEVRLYTDTD